MDAETRSRVFDPFFSTKFAGRGLGLPATLGIVRGHQGCLQLDSAPGHGTTVRVFLPALSEAQAVRPAASEPGVAASAGTVLVVDDEASVRTLAERMIQRCGYRTLGAPDGIEALRLVRERGREIDCVLLDLTMPKMDGEETLRELRAISPDLPVILCSGYHGLETSERFAGFRLAGFLQKPYQLADVKSKLQAALR
jgi:CheY-like chemotaxis protein